MTVTSLANYAQVQAIGLSVLRLQITNWGNVATGIDATSLLYGTLPSQALEGAYAVTIGPESTVDRVTLAYNAVFNSGATTASKLSGSNTLSQTLSVVRPAVNQLAGPLFVSCTRGPGYFNDVYYRDNDPNPHNFGGLEPLFELPFLQLDVHLRPPTNVLPTQRSPMFRSFNTAIINPEIPGTEQLIAIWPVMGRQRMTVACRAISAVGGLTASIRVGLITHGGNTTPTIAGTEATAGPVVSIDSAVGNQALYTMVHPAQYLALYATRTAGLGNVVGHMLAEDSGSCGTCTLA